mgnify:CR=1 FL=1
MTEQRLLNPEPHNWLMYRGNFSGWGYSPLEQITPANVKKLVPVWTFSTGVTEGHQSPPIVNNGVMFVTTPAAAGLRAQRQDWRPALALQEGAARGSAPAAPDQPRRGAVGRPTSTSPPSTPTSIALDAKTGKVVWDTTVDDYKKGYYFTLAPLIAKGKVMVGTSGGELGIRGYIAAFDVADGKPVWKTYTIPGRASPVTTPGPATPGRRAACRSGSPRTTIPSST